MLQSKPILNSGGSIVLRDAAAAVFECRGDQVALLNSHHMTFGLMMKLLFSRRPIIHRLAGPMALARPGVRGSLDDRIVAQIAKLSDVLVFQSRKSQSLNIGLLGLARDDTCLIHNPPSSALIEFLRDKNPAYLRPERRYAIVLNTSNPMKGVAIASELIETVGTANAVVIVKSDAMAAKLRRTMARDTRFEVCPDPQSFFRFIACHDVVVVPTLFEAGCNSFLEALAICPMTLVPAEGGLHAYGRELLGGGLDAFRLSSFDRVAQIPDLVAAADLRMSADVRGRRLNILKSLREQKLAQWTALANDMKEVGKASFWRKMHCFLRIIAIKLLQKLF